MSVSPTLLPTLNTTQPVYLWVVGSAAAALPEGSTVGDRFHILSSRIWQDTQPHRPLTRNVEMPASVVSYLKLHRHRLHLPEPYIFFTLNGTPSSKQTEPMVLLHNAPIDAQGQLLPSIEEVWSQASAVRQLHWLWQISQLWPHLAQENVVSSLLQPSNLRVDDWRIRLCELQPDTPQVRQPLSGDRPADVPLSADSDTIDLPGPNGSLQASPQSQRLLQALGELWMTWAETAQPEIQTILRTIAEALQSPQASWKAIAPQLNEALLYQAAQQPLRLDIAGTTLPGRERTHNEDAAFPLTLSDNGSGDSDAASGLHPRLAMVCDGIGGHVGGEVASQLVVRALKLQISALFADLADPTNEDLTPPHLVAQQLEAAVRVVNNLISVQNDGQGRQQRQRMGTTLAMSVQLPQRIQTPNGKANAHELYLVNVGDSRAYWLTPQSCHCLTLDDDVKTREVLAGRSLPREAARRSDAIALTQALGTRQGEHLHISVQRFVIEEDGILLLCSDGLSDNHLIERHWQPLTTNVLRGHGSLNEAVSHWVDLANQHNGHDNISLVMMRCRVSKESLNLFDPSTPTPPIQQRVMSLGQTPSQPSTASSKPAPTLPSHSATTSSSNGEPASSPSSQPSSRPSPKSASTAADKGILGRLMLAMKPRTLSKNSKQTSKQTSQAQRSASKRPSAPNPSQTTSPSHAPNFDTLETLASELAGDRPLPESALELDDHSQDWNWMAIALGLAVVMFCTSSAGIIAWRYMAPEHFNRTWNSLVERYGELLLPIESAPIESAPGNSETEQPQSDSETPTIRFPDAPSEDSSEDSSDDSRGDGSSES